VSVRPSVSQSVRKQYGTVFKSNLFFEVVVQKRFRNDEAVEGSHC